MVMVNKNANVAVTIFKIFNKSTPVVLYSMWSAFFYEQSFSVFNKTSLCSFILSGGPQFLPRIHIACIPVPHCLLTLPTRYQSCIELLLMHTENFLQQLVIIKSIQLARYGCGLSECNVCFAGTVHQKCIYKNKTSHFYFCVRVMEQEASATVG